MDFKFDDKKELQFIIDCLFQESRGDGVLYMKLNSDKLIYDVNFKEWYFWNGIYWELDDFGFHKAEVENVARAYEICAEKIIEGRKDDEGFFKKVKIQKLFKNASYLRTSAGRNSCIDFVIRNVQIKNRENQKILHRSLDLNAHPYLLPCKNAVIDLETGEAISANPFDYMTRVMDVNYDPNFKDIPLFLQFLKDVYNNDQELIRYIQMVLGHSLIGEVIEHKFFVFTGRGRNGKGVLLDLILKMFGTFGTPIPVQLFLESSYTPNANSPTPVLLSFYGRRFILTSEAKKNKKYDTEMIKFMTGNEMIYSRSPHEKKEFVFPPSHSSFMRCNENPLADINDDAFFKRLDVVPHDIQFVAKPKGEFEKKIDFKIAQKLASEKSGILNWLLEGCQMFLKDGLFVPKAVEMASSQYKDDSDILGIHAFLEDKCIIGKENSIEFSLLYDCYVGWYQENVDKRVDKLPSNLLFGKEIRSAEKKILQDKQSGKMYYKGVTCII